MVSAQVKRCFCACVLLIAAAYGGAQSAQAPADAPYRSARTPVEDRVKDALGRMTVEEKASMLAGSGWMESTPVPRLGIPAIKMADGPMGVRSWLGSSAITSGNAAVKITSTSFPAGVAMAATWDTELVQREGKAIAQETKALGRDMILGPTVNINRVPLWGRNFEGYGEDPFLAGKLGAAYVRGVQAEGVIPSVKHFAANNEEYERHRIDDEKISERALHEIYLPAFKTTIQEGGAWNVMSAYNLVNGAHMAENYPLLHDVLQDEFGFKGFVISDWGSTYSTAPTVNAGMDLEMPGGEAMKRWMSQAQTQKNGNGDGWLVPEKVLAEVKAGHVTEAQLNDSVSRILRVMFESGMFDRERKVTGAVDTPEHRAVALQGATEGIVLLKNEGGLLPLDAAKVKSIAVIGPNAAAARTGGGGSSLVRPKYATAPLEGIKNHEVDRIKVTYALGVGMEGEDPAHDTAEARARDLKEAVEAASHADVAVVVVGRYNKIESEGFDLKTMDLPAGQDELIAAVEKANPHTVVVLNTGDPVTMTKWLNQTPALLDMWYGGQEGGWALAQILFGDVSPSGKLPVTLPKRFEDSPAYGHYPGENLKVDYAEGIYVGYRYYDTKNVEPAFPFGFGLSYTKFEYSDLKIGRAGATKWTATVKIRNTGTRAGAEVVQLYVHDGHAKIDRPAHELKGFQRVELKAGESKDVEFAIDRAALSYWDPAGKSWKADPGQFEVQVGASSRDIRLRGNFELR